MPMHIPLCTLCGGQQTSPLFNGPDISYVICNKCTLVYLNPRPTESKYETLYRDEYQKQRHNITTYEEAVARIESKGSYNRRRSYLSDLDPFITKDSRVLEIGSGWGALSRLIADTYKCEVHSIETGELQASVAEKYFKLNVFCGTLSDFARLHDGQLFDVIIMTHVLEHMSDLETTFKQLSSLLSHKGFLYIAVPNIAKPNEALDRFFHFEHCYYFSPFTLNILLKKYGFKIIYMSTQQDDLRIMTARLQNKTEEIDTSDFHTQYSKKHILKIINKQKRKYTLLRLFKVVVHFVLPEKFFTIVRSKSITMLKKLHIIDI